MFKQTPTKNREKQSEKALDALKNLFVNRCDCYCIQHRKGYARIAEPLTNAVLESHLNGEITVGSYQLDKDSCVKGLCFDLDPEHLKDPEATAKKILAVVFETEKDTDGNDIPRVCPNCVVLEASRYPDPSFHIWLLFLLPVKAKVARWLGLRVLEMANLSPKTVEVFPKQEEITQDRPYGNFVKLPFGFHQVERKWSRLLDFDTFKPLPPEQIEEKHGLSFSEKDLAKLESTETKRNVQVSFELPKTFNKLSAKDEEKSVCFLMKYWREGYRNELTISFCGLYIKSGVSFESAKRVIEEVCRRTNTSTFETSEFLNQVSYQYMHRQTVGNLKGISGIRAVIKAIKEKEQFK